MRLYFRQCHRGRTAPNKEEIQGWASLRTLAFLCCSPYARLTWQLQSNKGIYSPWVTGDAEYLKHGEDSELTILLLCTQGREGSGGKKKSKGWTTYSHFLRYKGKTRVACISFSQKLVPCCHLLWVFKVTALLTHYPDVCQRRETRILQEAEVERSYKKMKTQHWDVSATTYLALLKIEIIAYYHY